MNDEFASPGSTTRLSMSGLQGHLLLIEPHALEAVTTPYDTDGPSPAIRANVTDLTDGAFYDDALIFSSVVVGALRTRLGQRVLAELGQGVPKPGQSAPWQLFDRSGDEVARQKARAAIQGRGSTISASKPTLAQQVAADKRDIQARKNLEQGFGALSEVPPF